MRIFTGHHAASSDRISLFGFPLVYIGWAYLCWLPLLLSTASVWSFPSILFFLAGGASPLLAAVALPLYQGERRQLVDLGRRLVDLRRIPAWWWLVLLLFWPAFNLCMGAVALLLGITAQPFDIPRDLFETPALFLFLLLLSFVFPAVEEVGLRGYYLDALQRHMHTAPAALLNGALWALWHTPFVWFPGYYDNTTFHPELSWWLPMIVCTTLLITEVYNRTGRSIFAALVFHGMMNFTGELLGIAPAMYPFVLSGYVVLALLLLVIWYRRGKARDRHEAS